MISIPTFSLETLENHIQKRLSSPSLSNRCYYATDYYLKQASSASSIWERTQAGSQDQLMLIYQQLYPNDSTLFSQKELYPEEFYDIIIPHVLNRTEAKEQTAPNCVNSKANQVLKRTATIDYILFDQPLMNLVSAKNLQFFNDESIYEFIVDETCPNQQLIWDALLYWFDSRQRKNGIPDSFQSVFQLQRKKVPQKKDQNVKIFLSRRYTKARLLLHMQFFSARGAHNSDIHSPRFYFRPIEKIKAKSNSIDKGLYSDNDAIFKLLDPFPMEDQWYYEMSTGLSLTAEIVAFLLELDNQYKGRRSKKTRIDCIIRLLSEFREQIVSCPAVFWRSAILRHIFFALDRSGVLIKEFDQAKESFHRLLLKYGNEIGGVAINNSSQLNTSCFFFDPPQIFSQSMQNYIDFLLQSVIDNESFPAKMEEQFVKHSPHRPIPPFYFSQMFSQVGIVSTSEHLSKQCAENFHFLYSLGTYGNFPFGFCVSNRPHIKEFRTLAKSGERLPPKTDNLFSSVHKALYPGGYELLDFHTPS